MQSQQQKYSASAQPTHTARQCLHAWKLPRVPPHLPQRHQSSRAMAQCKGVTEGLGRGLTVDCTARALSFYPLSLRLTHNLTQPAPTTLDRCIASASHTQHRTTGKHQQLSALAFRHGVLVMSGEHLLAKLRQVYSRCAHDVDSWVQAKVRVLRL